MATGGVRRLLEALYPGNIRFGGLDSLKYFCNKLAKGDGSSFGSNGTEFVACVGMCSGPSMGVCTRREIGVNRKRGRGTVRCKSVLFANSSRAPSRYKVSSIVARCASRVLCLGSFYFKFELGSVSVFSPRFLGRLFEDRGIEETVTGATDNIAHFGISGGGFTGVVVPVPPLRIRGRVTGVLSGFARLTTRLRTRLRTEGARCRFCHGGLLAFGRVKKMWCKEE